MALIKCPECGKEISDRAGACPNCGCPINNGVETNPTTVQIRVVCKTTLMTVDGQSTDHGKIVTINNVKGSKRIRITAFGGAVGIGSGLNPTVEAGHKYDLDAHMTLTGRMLYLKEVSQFV